MSVTKFEPPGGHQLTLEPDDDDAWSDAEAAVDRIRDRYGSAAIGPAVLAGPDGLKVKRRGDQQWGPQDDAHEHPLTGCGPHVVGGEPCARLASSNAD